jgi:membrane associated rhomboid family serine protease
MNEEEELITNRGQGQRKPTTVSKRRANVRERYRQFRKLSPLSQILSVVLFVFYLLDFRLREELGIKCSFVGVISRPWTIITSSFVTPSVGVVPVIVLMIFVIEVLIARAFVKARVLLEVIFVSATSTGSLYVLFDSTQRFITGGEGDNGPRTTIALGCSGIVGGLLVLCSKLKNEISEDDFVRKVARNAHVWYLIVMLFVGGEINNEERVFGVSLFGCVGGLIYFRVRGRRVLLYAGVNARTTTTQSNVNKEIDEEEEKRKKIREDIGRKALMERLKENGIVEESSNNNDNNDNNNDDKKIVVG